jgi:hypothetical protein
VFALSILCSAMLASNAFAPIRADLVHSGANEDG